MIYSHEVLREFIDTKLNGRSKGWGNRELVFNEDRVSV